MFSLTNRMYLMAAKKQPSMMMKMNPLLKSTISINGKQRNTTSSAEILIVFS